MLDKAIIIKYNSYGFIAYSFYFERMFKMKTFKDICYGNPTIDAHKLDLYLPDAEEFPVFVYFHGGGLVNGSRKSQTKVFEKLAEKGIAVASVEYRMYPAAKYPDFILDSARSVAWVKENINKYGSCEKIYVGGSSAGGYISMMLCFDPMWYAAYGVRPAQIAGYIHDAGQPTCHFNVLKERGIDSRRVIIDNSAPLYHIGNGTKYPPMLFIVSDNDMENRYEQTMLVMGSLKHFRQDGNATLKIMNGTHCAYVDRFNEDGSSVFADIISDYISSLG